MQNMSIWNVYVFPELFQTSASTFVILLMKCQNVLYNADNPSIKFSFVILYKINIEWYNYENNYEIFSYLCRY